LKCWCRSASAACILDIEPAFFANRERGLWAASLELFGSHKNGHEFPVEISLSPLQTGEGTLITSAIRDISERKRALGLHSYDPGVSPTLVTWISPIPNGDARADFDNSTAELHIRNVCVFDAFAVSNSLNPTHPLGNIVSAVIESLDLRWSGVTRSIIGFSDPVNQFSGDLFETSAAISVTARTKESTGHGFRFVSSATTKVNFAQFGRETNGVFF